MTHINMPTTTPTLIFMAEGDGRHARDDLLLHVAEHGAVRQRMRRDSA